jgi:hypothetical protein
MKTNLRQVSIKHFHIHGRKRPLTNLPLCTMGHMHPSTDLNPDACYHALASHGSQRSISCSRASCPYTFAGARYSGYAPHS